MEPLPVSRGSEPEVLGRDRKSSASAFCSPLAESARRLYKILLRVFLGGVLGLGRAAEGEIRPVFLFDPLHFLVPVGLFPPVEEPARHRQAGHRQEDRHGDDACGGREGPGLTRFHTNPLKTLSPLSAGSSAPFSPLSLNLDSAMKRSAAKVGISEPVL